jgi:hypothetical protein
MNPTYRFKFLQIVFDFDLVIFNFSCWLEPLGATITRILGKTRFAGISLELKGLKSTTMCATLCSAVNGSNKLSDRQVENRTF